MTTISFVIEEANEVPKIKNVLKALGAKKLKISMEQDDETKMTKKDFFAKIDKAKNEKGTETSIEQLKKTFL